MAQPVGLITAPERKYIARVKAAIRWKYVKSGIGYHIGIDHRFYSVPHALVSHRLEARVCATTVEVFDEGQ